MRRLFLLLLPLALACGGDLTTEPAQVSVAGTWELQSVNGSALPFVVAQTPSSKVEVMGDVITALSSGTWTEILEVRSTQNGQSTTQSVTDAGSFTMNGTSVTFVASDGSSGSGFVTGNTFTLSMDGFARVYKKK